MKTYEKAVKKLAKKLGVKYTTKEPSNRFRGYKNGNQMLYHNLENDKVTLICTCRNCGDGSSVSMESFVKFK